LYAGIWDEVSVSEDEDVLRSMHVMAPVIDREASRPGQGDAADPQFYEDIDQVTFDASSPGNQAIQCAPQPPNLTTKSQTIKGIYNRPQS